MGFNKRHLPSYKKLKEMVNTWGKDYVVKMYTGPKVDALIGDSKSFEYFEKIKEEYDIKPRNRF